MKNMKMMKLNNERNILKIINQSKQPNWLCPRRAISDLYRAYRDELCCFRLATRIATSYSTSRESREKKMRTVSWLSSPICR